MRQTTGPFQLMLVGLVALVTTVAPSHAQATCDGLGCVECSTDVRCSGFQPTRRAARWSATVDAIFLDRSDPSSGILAFNTEEPNERLDANDFDFGVQPGVDVSLGCELKSCWGLEIRYFGVNDWDDSQLISTTSDDLLQFNAAPPVFVESGNSIASTFASRLHNAEVNITHEVCDWLGLLAGFRFLELNEKGLTSLVDADSAFAYGVTTSNQLYGGQLGAITSLWCSECFQIDAVAKAGIYGNHSQHDGLLATNAATVVARGSDDRTAFIGEIALTGSACITRCLKLRGGYRLLWLDEVALATDQLAVTNFNDGVGYHGSGDVFYHGAFAGIELCH